MKKLWLSLILVPSFLIGQQRIKSYITDVTVFVNGAQVSRSASTDLKSGTQDVIFTNLTQNLDANSIQLNGKGDFTIVSIIHQNNFLTEENKSETLLSLETQMEELQIEIEKNNAKTTALNAEKEVLLANKSVGGTTGAQMSNLQQTATFIRKRLEEINIEIIYLTKGKKDLEKQRQKLQNQINEERQSFGQKTGEVKVTLDVPRAQAATFSLSYLVYNAGWVSSYDVRVNDLSQPVALTHKAKIYQQTGEDWNNVNLALATGNPSAGAQVPEMFPWHVSSNTSAIRYAADAPVKRKAEMMSNMSSSIRVEADDLAEAEFQSFNISQNLTQQEYTVSRKQSIASDNSPVTVVLRDLTIPAEYEYHAKPRLDKDAFLVAKVYDWGKLDLLPGEISLFNNETYVGKSYLNTENPGDTLQLSLGRDQNVVVKRTRVYSKQEKSFFGNTRTDNFTWKLEVKNNKKNAIKLLLRDQVPVSHNDEIKVTINEIAGAKYEEKTGFLTWKMELQPNQGITKEISYEVKYPKDVTIRY